MIKKIVPLSILAFIFTLLAPIQLASALEIPSGLSATGNRNGGYSEGTVTISWTPVAGADNGYAIQTILNGAQVGNLTGATGQGTNSAVVSGLQGGTTYSFKIRAVSTSAVSPWSSAVTASPVTSPSTPAKPTHTNSLLDVTVRWAAPASDGGAGITSYVVTEANSGRTQTVSSTTFNAQFNAFASASKVKFNVRAINGVTTEGTASANSDETTLPSVPSKIIGVVVARTSTKDEMRVTWEIPGNGGSALTGFEVFLRKSGADVQTVQVTDIEATSSIFTGLSAGSYSAQVLAKNVIGSGERSTEPTAIAIEGLTAAVAATSGGSGGGGGGGGGGGSAPTPSPSATPTPTPTVSATPSATAKPTPIASPKPTPIPTPSAVVSPVPTSSKSPTSKSATAVAGKTITASLPKSIKPAGAKTKITDANGRVVPAAKINISSSGKVSVTFPKGTKPGVYRVKVTSKSDKVWYLPVTVKKK